VAVGEGLAVRDGPADGDGEGDGDGDLLGRFVGDGKPPGRFVGDGVAAGCVAERDVFCLAGAVRPADAGPAGLGGRTSR
jgi:hypothetical protein